MKIIDDLPHDLDPKALTCKGELSYSENWCIHLYEQVPSTNALAGHLPAWHAVRARTQTAGRGRAGHSWVSNLGGLWLSAVVPCPSDEAVWAYLPLAVGWGLLRSLRKMGVHGARLRWPNDLMVGRKKLAGILVERFTPETIVVGVGVNVLNYPSAIDGTLTATSTRLADLIEQPESLTELTIRFLRAIRSAHDELWAHGFSPIADELNATWTERKSVQLLTEPDASPIVGEFVGIDDCGALRLKRSTGVIEAFDAARVSLLTECN